MAAWGCATPCNLTQRWKKSPCFPGDCCAPLGTPQHQVLHLQFLSGGSETLQILRSCRLSRAEQGIRQSVSMTLHTGRTGLVSNTHTHSYMLRTVKGFKSEITQKHTFKEKPSVFPTLLSPSLPARRHTTQCQKRPSAGGT